MTKREVAKLLGYAERGIHPAFQKAAENNPTMKKKLGNYTRTRSVDFSLEECIEALKTLPTFTPMQQRLLKENFIKRDKPFAEAEKKNPFTSALHDFCFCYRTMLHNRKHFEVCATCTYLIPKTPNKPGCKPAPYCKFYEVFLNKALPKRNIYKDKCPTYVWTYRRPPLWGRNGYMGNDMDNLTQTTTLGIPNTEFTTGLTKGDEPIILLKDGFEE